MAGKQSQSLRLCLKKQRRVIPQSEKQSQSRQRLNEIGFVFRTGGLPVAVSLGKGGAIGFVFRPFLSQVAHSKPHIGFVSPKFCPFLCFSRARRRMLARQLG